MLNALKTCFLVLLTWGLAHGQTRDLTYEPAKAAKPADGGKRWALVIGVSTYKNVPPQAQLRFAHRDAESLAHLLRSPEGGGLPASQVRVLTEQTATLGAIRAALHTWLPKMAGPQDVVTLFIAGHGILDSRGHGYFVAHDSDPQNLHATGLSFREVNDTLSRRLRARMVVVLADACHAGGIGWTSQPGTPSRAHSALEALGGADRAFLKVLASRPTEQSFEDEHLDGGHGVFTYALLEGLKGGAEQERDGVVRAGELIEFVSRTVPARTQARQNPRVAGNFETRTPLSSPGDEPVMGPAAAWSVTVRAPAGSNVYLDSAFRGAVRPTGELVVDNVTQGAHGLSVDLPSGASWDQALTVQGPKMVVDLGAAQSGALTKLEALAKRGQVLDPGGAWDTFRQATWPPAQQAQAQAVVSAALEEIGQECVSDYVQSTVSGLKRRMLLRAADAYERLKTLRPEDRELDAKRHFCRARAEIAGGQFAQALESLKESLAIEPEFACAHNATGVALDRLGRPQEAREAYQRAMTLTPEWSLPFLQVGQQQLGKGDAAGALSYLIDAAKFNPRSVTARWTLLRAYRLLGKDAEVEREAAGLTALNANYAPTYLELGLHREARRDYARAAEAFDAYLTLAPNFADSTDVRARAAKIRTLATRSAPKLKK